MALKDDPAVKEGIKELKVIFKFLLVLLLVVGLAFGVLALLLMTCYKEL